MIVTENNLFLNINFEVIGAWIALKLGRLLFFMRINALSLNLL